MSLFADLPAFDLPLPADDLRLLASLPEWPTIQEVDHPDRPSLRRLVGRGLAKASWEKTDPISIHRTPFAGRLVPVLAALSSDGASSRPLAEDQGQVPGDTHISTQSQEDKL